MNIPARSVQRRTSLTRVEENDKFPEKTPRHRSTVVLTLSVVFKILRDPVPQRSFSCDAIAGLPRRRNIIIVYASGRRNNA